MVHDIEKALRVDRVAGDHSAPVEKQVPPLHPLVAEPVAIPVLPTVSKASGALGHAAAVPREVQLKNGVSGEQIGGTLTSVTFVIV